VGEWYGNSNIAGEAERSVEGVECLEINDELNVI
jgi:hypothetical protein